jgi:hypothetical protein
MSEVKVNKISPRTNCGTVTVGDAGDSVTVTAGVPVTVNGDLKSNALKAVDGGSIISQCGTNITLGASGDTINLAAGASQTGFGRTGTVDWDTTAKTAGFTAVSGTGYFVNTTSGAITVTLPATPSAGDIVSVKDYTGTFGTNTCTVARNGSNIRGAASDFEFEKNNSGGVFIYVDATEGWQIFVDGSDGDAQAQYISATGGTTTTCGDFKIHTFTSPGTFTVCQVADNPVYNEVDYLVVAGGGGGGWNNNNAPQGASGGGAGGFRLSNSTCMPAPLTSPLATPTGITVTATAFPVTVGAGGAAATPSPNTNGYKGADSVFSTITSTGGGFGSGDTDQPFNPGDGGPGGSGGGAHQCNPSKSTGAGNTPPVSPPQGNPGGTGSSPSGEAGGGAGGVAINSTPGNNAGSGGVGSFVAGSGFAGCNGTPGPVCGARYFAGGGGGANSPGRSPSGSNGAGGVGGGGDGTTSPTGGNGVANTGGGGGGSANAPGAGVGGSGIVIIRYKFK